VALKIKWSKRADNSFERIIEYLHAEWGDISYPISIFISMAIFHACSNPGKNDVLKEYGLYPSHNGK